MPAQILVFPESGEGGTATHRGAPWGIWSLTRRFLARISTLGPWEERTMRLGPASAWEFKFGTSEQARVWVRCRKVGNRPRSRSPGPLSAGEKGYR